MSVVWLLSAGIHFQRDYTRCCKPPFDASKPFDPVELPNAPWINVYADDLIIEGLVIVVVPLAILFLGLVVAWVIRGFKRIDVNPT